MSPVEKWENHHRSIENIIQGIQYDQETGGRHLRKTEYKDWKQKNTWPSAKDQKQNTFGVYGDKDKGRTVYCS